MTIQILYLVQDYPTGELQFLFRARQHDTTVGSDVASRVNAIRRFDQEPIFLPFGSSGIPAPASAGVVTNRNKPEGYNIELNLSSV